ncbi:MAG: M23 family metallopeptidase [Dissulfurispiraceae bacterium]|jgi:murein DD-endopeptidase MepM/ murein hydrolase activator NlpD|nr:M23 family metallopeptidase [Dissulfurispiraceae bacterium]
MMALRGFLLFIKKHSFIFAAVLLLSSSAAYAFDCRIIPDVIKPGDPFLVKIEGSATEPAALFEGRKLLSISCGESCYLFIGAVDVGAAPGKYIVNISSSAKSVNAEFNLKDGGFREIHLTLPGDKVTLDSETLKRVIHEKAMLDDIFARNSSAAWTGSFVYPLDSDVTSGFGNRRIINKSITSIHRGIDMRARTGDLVRAANTGKVVLAKELFYGGNTVIVDHGLGIFTIYMHLSEFKAMEGDIISKNQVLGLAGSTGRSSGPHLHFGVKIQSQSINPISFLGLGI